MLALRSCLRKVLAPWALTPQVGDSACREVGGAVGDTGADTPMSAAPSHKGGTGASGKRLRWDETCAKEIHHPAVAVEQGLILGLNPVLSGQDFDLTQGEGIKLV